MPEATATPAPAMPGTPPPDLVEAMETPTDPPGKSGGEPFNDAFADLDKLIEPTKPSPKPSEKKPADNKPAPDKKAAEPADKKPADVADKKPAEALDKKPTEPAGKRSPWQIVHDKEAEISALRKQLAERDSAKPNGQWEKERADLLKRIEERDARLAEREKELEFSAFEQSEKYRSEFERPYINAWNLGRKAMERFKVTTAEGDVRPGKPEDFDFLMRLEETDPDAAAEKLAEMFGAKASYVSAHMVKVKEQFQRIQDAREEYRTRGEEERKLKSERSEKENGEFRSLAESIGKDAAQRYADLFEAPADDTAGRAKVSEGEDFANRFFSAPNDKALTKQQQAALAAIGYLKLRGFDWQVSRRMAAEKRVKELEAELADYKASEPTPGEAGKKPVASEDELGADLANYVT